MSSGSYGRARSFPFSQYKSLFVLLPVSLFHPSPPVRADTHSDYRLIGRFVLPAGAGPLAAMPDGTLVTLIHADVYVETAPGARTFALLGTLPGADIASFGAAFLRVSPDGSRVAVGNNGGASFADFEVGVFTIPGLTGAWFTAPHFDAVWVDDTLLALTAAEFGFPSRVTLLDTESPDPADPVNPTIINNIGGASGGVAIDASENLFTGNGFSTSGPSGTGLIKAFTASQWMAAASGTPLDFEVDGIEIVDVLSASPLGFDVSGNLIVGGGDSSTPGQSDYVAVLSASAIADALSGGGPIPSNHRGLVARLDPDPSSDGGFFTFAYGASRTEIYVNDFGDLRVHVFRDLMGVPAASAWGLVLLALAMAIAATLTLRSARGPHMAQERCR